MIYRNSAIHELKRMQLIIWRGRSTNDKMIQVVVKRVQFIVKKNPIKLLLFLQPNTSRFVQNSIEANLSAPFFVKKRCTPTNVCGRTKPSTYIPIFITLLLMEGPTYPPPAPVHQLSILVVTQLFPPLASIMFIINCTSHYPYLFFLHPLTSRIHFVVHLI